jgi:poly(3-hydroxyalkanoate) synthetase
LVWAVSISLATTLEITVVFSSSAYLDVSVQQVRAFMQSIFNRLGFPIRKSADQFIFADPRSLSQLITSFIASESQGIPRVPFLTFFYSLRLLLVMVCFFILVAV